MIFGLKGCGNHCDNIFPNTPFTGVSMLFSDVCAVTSPKSPTITDPSKEKKILDGCNIRGKETTHLSQLFEKVLLHI